MRPTKKNFKRFSVLYEVGSVAEETVKHQSLSTVKLFHDISRL